MATILEEAQVMGLEADPNNGLYRYQDRYSEIIYRTLQTLRPTYDGVIPHITDGYQVPTLAIFTRGAGWPVENFKYVGCVSNIYKFIGNDVLNQIIRESITSIGFPIVSENTIFSPDYTVMRNELIIRNGQNVANVGDVLPIMIVNNSYNGTRAASVMFGICFNADSSTKVNFAFRLGEMRQVHISNSPTLVTSAIHSYINTFSENISDMIQQSFTTHLTENEMLGVLDLVEGLGKKRREKVSGILNELQKQSGNELPTSWQMFVAIVRYSSMEPNLNIKRMIENIAESTLVIPTRMYEVLEKIQ